MDPYLLLAVAEGCGPGMVAGLLDPGRDPRTILADPPGLPAAAARRLRSDRLQATAQAWLERAAALGLSVLTPADAGYPSRLRQRPLRPNALFARGRLDLLTATAPVLAVIGSRTPTAYGEGAAGDFATVASRAGVTIASGLAYGIDAEAHRCAVAAGGPTVAVLAGGLDRIYPTSHTELADAILGGGGLLLSELPPGMGARRGHFPRRNRILAGLADAVLVVEAGLRSGSLHTARFAAEQGVPVFAVPGPYTSPRSLGCHALLADGAQVAASPPELLRELGVAEALRDATRDGSGLGLCADQEAVLRVLQAGPRPADLVARESGLPSAAFLAAVHALRSRGLLQAAAGDQLVAVAGAAGRSPSR